MKGLIAIGVFALVLVGIVVLFNGQPTTQEPTASVTLPPSDGVRMPADFSVVPAGGARARALFEEVTKVLKHPRCTNCHPSTERPLQGEQGDLHQPLVVRGAGGLGAPGGMLCINCHGSTSFGRVPGSPGWVLAPAALAWEGASTTEICDGLKKHVEARGRSLQDLIAFVTNNSLVAYGFAPAEHLEPAPGSQKQLAKLVAAWVEQGADCP
ncbi:MAG: Isoquinoline 1-oxidoreductase subunit [Myxococcota bacterium]